MAYAVKVKSKLYLRLARNNPHLFFPNALTLNYLRYKFTKPRRTVDHAKVSPVFVTYFVTNRCNLACSFCMVGNVLNPKDWRSREATVETTERLFRRPVAKRALYVMLSGGEPTINQEIAPIIQLLKKQGRLVAMTTNGHYLPQKADDLIRSGLDSINVSLYPDNFVKVRETLPEITPRIHAKICKVITRQMLDDPIEIEAAVELAQAVGAQGIYLANVFPSHNAPTALDTSIIYDRDEGLLNSVKERIGAKFRNIPIYWPAPAPMVRAPLKLCRMPWYFVTFDSQGNMGMCCNSANCTQGNIFDLAPAEVMNTDEWKTVRDGLLSPGPVASICSTCYMMNDRYGSNV
ncbi:MAG: radical SAM protein [Alphaproteobacteria bacterium]|nr:radical SAM protein [Alphaproteobacteria bacterium]